jgi:formate hydrogenlyase subunit 3/multisubunit Na+/H+ antiporter MnhD subunit
VGLVSISKITLISVVLVSLAHGWAAIAIFLIAGTLSYSTFSRLGTIVRRETSLFWFIVIFSIILISNAGIPPMPSFFPELFMVATSLRRRGYSVLIFLLIRFYVCYYNAYLFLWISHIKPRVLSRGKIFFIEGLRLFFLVLLRFESLFWIIIF